jgi:hypothetical protein
MTQGSRDSWRVDNDVLLGDLSRALGRHWEGIGRTSF